MSSDETPKVDVMQGLKSVLSKIEAAVAKRSKVSIYFYLTYLFYLYTVLGW